MSELTDKLKDARKRVYEICWERKPRMQIPARPDADDDLVICGVIDEAITALEQAPTRAAVEDAMISVWDDAISSQWDGIGGMDESISKALDDLGFPTPDPADAEGEQQDG